MRTAPIPGGTSFIRLAAIAALIAIPTWAQTPIGGAQSGTLAAGVYTTTGSISVAPATTWTLSAGVIIKFTNGGHNLVVNGTLNANGTAGNPVILTAYADDSAGGDTNANGPSSGSPTSWQGVIWNAGAGGSLSYTHIRFGGSSFVSNVELNSASPTFANCAIHACHTDGMDLNGNSAPTVTGCSFTSNGGYAIQRAPIGAVPGITGNTGSSNSVNSIHVTSGTLAANVAIGSASNFSGGILLGTTITIPAGRTLTLNAGTILKFDSSGWQVSVDGTLTVNGTAGSPVVFTDDADDTAGGDTNSNGPGTGSPTAWEGIIFNQGSNASSLTYADIRYGGSSFVSNVEMNSASPTLTNCTIRNCYTDGMDLNGGAANGPSLPTVTGCTFTGNGGYAIQRAHLRAVPGVTSNTASGNGVNSIHVTDATLASNVAINATSNLSGGILVGTTITIQSGVTLALSSGAILKLDHTGVEVAVDGTLQANGAIFTDDADDSAGGDTNSDGASAGSPTAWRGIVFNPTSTGCTLTSCDVRYGGAAFVSNIELNSASPTLTGCTIRDCFTDGMDLNGNSNPTVTGCTFTSNGGYAVQRVHVGAVAGLTANTATSNGVNSLHVTHGVMTASTTITAASNMTGGILVGTTISIPAGVTLALGAGVNLKLDNNGWRISVDGTLLANGTLASPVVFTDDADDSAGGDTNTNGASSGSWTAWEGIVFNPGSNASVLNYADVRYGGSAYVSNVELSGASPTFTNCTIRSCFTDGMDLNANSKPTVVNCTFTGNGGRAVQNAQLSALPGFTNNTAAANVGNFIRVVDGAVSSALTIGAQSIMNGALVVATDVVVQPAGVLTLGPGVVVKLENNAQSVDVQGAANLRGTAYEPVVFTALADDSWGGDTNDNGPSSGSPTAWEGISVGAGAQPSLFENVLIRYTGSAWVPALSSASPTLALRSVRVDKAFDRGFVLSALGANAVNLVAWGCGGYGIQLAGGAFSVIHATCHANGTGVRKEVAWTGAVMNSIVWGNGANYANFAGSEVSFSNGGFNPANNNVDVDPKFVDAANGDFRLQATSPCLDTADLFTAFAVLKDADEMPRILDSALAGTPAADMGAYERAAWDMNVYGVPRIGTPLVFEVVGQAGDSIYALGFLDGTLPLPPYGIVLAGAVPYVTVVQLVPFTVPANTQLVIPIPYDPSLVGYTGAIQALTTPTGNTSVGNLTQVYRATIRP
jgi:parallel beta-helix repeat protein